MTTTLKKYTEESREALFNKIHILGYDTLYEPVKHNVFKYGSPEYFTRKKELEDFVDQILDLASSIVSKIDKNRIDTTKNSKICFLPKVKCKRDIIRNVPYLSITRLKGSADYIIADTSRFEQSQWYFYRAGKILGEFCSLVEWKDLNRVVEIKNLLYYNCTEQKTMTKEEFRELSALVKSKDQKIAVVALSKVCDYKIEDSALFIGYLIQFFRSKHHYVQLQDKPTIFIKYYDIFMDLNNLKWALGMDLKTTLPRISELPNVFIEQYIEITSSLFPKGWRLVKDAEPEKVTVPAGQITNWEL